MEWLKLADIEIVPEAQRRFIPQHAAKIAAEFDPDALGKPLIVCIRKPNSGAVLKYVCSDGQHRIAATRMALGEDQRIECEVVDGDIKLATKLYRMRNTIRLPRSIDKFLAGVTAEDKEVLQIVRILSNHSLRVAEGGNWGSGTLACVSALQRIYRLDNGHLLDKTLASIIQAYGRESDNFIGDFIIGFGLFLRRYPTVDMDALIKKLTAQPGGVTGIIGRARTLREAMGGSVSSSVGRALVMLYNIGRRTGKLADWDARE